MSTNTKHHPPNLTTSASLLQGANLGEMKKYFRQNKKHSVRVESEAFNVFPASQKVVPLPIMRNSFEAGVCFVSN